MPFNLSFKRKGTNSEHKFKKVQIPGEDSEDKKGKMKADQDVDDQTKRTVGGKTDAEEDEDKQELAPEGSKNTPEAVVKRQVVKVSKTPHDVYGRFWNKYGRYKLADIEHSDTGKFIPNGLALERLIIETLDVVGETVWMEKNRPNFCAYAAATGLCYLYFIVILRAGKEAGKLTTQDRKTIDNFFKAVPEESIMIPAPFVPYFEAIAATELKDSKYEWVIPTYPALANATSISAFATNARLDQIMSIVPNVPAMLAVLAQFATMANTDFNTHVEDERLYRPVNLARTNANSTTRILGVDALTNANDWSNADSHVVNTLQHNGMRIPFNFYNDNGKAVLRDIKRSGFLGEMVTATTTTGVDISFSGTRTGNGGATGVTLQESKAFTSIENVLFLERTKNPAWTNYLWKNVNHVAEHFPESRSLKEIGKTQGMECAILCQLKTRNAHTNGYVYDNSRFGKAGSRNVEYYNHEVTRDLQGSFKTFRGDVERQDELNAFAFGMVATPPIHGITVGDYRMGSFYTDPEHDGSVIRELGHYANEDRGTVQMYTGYELDIVRPMFKTKGV